jgi:hypothetical protein
VDKSQEDRVKLQLLEIKAEFPNMVDIDVFIIHEQKLFDKLKLMSFFLKTSLKDKEEYLDKYCLGNIKALLSDDNSHIELVSYMILLHNADLKLNDFYKYSEVADNKFKGFLKAIGYKYRNKTLQLDKHIKRLIRCT